jgi:hypothetical protein
MEPRSGDGIDFQGRQGHSPKHAVQIGRKEGIEDLAQPIIMPRCGGQPGLKEGHHAALLQTRPHLVERMMAIENR